MNNSHICIEQILILAFHLAVLFSLRQTFKESIKKLRKQVKRLPRKLKPRSPKDCPDCQSGVKLAVLKPKTDVIPYAQRKSTGGRTKHLATQGHACPNPKCDYRCNGKSRGSQKQASKDSYPGENGWVEAEQSQNRGGRPG